MRQCYSRYMAERRALIALDCFPAGEKDVYHGVHGGEEEERVDLIWDWRRKLNQQLVWGGDEDKKRRQEARS